MHTHMISGVSLITHATNPVCAKMDITDFPISILNEITPMDIEEYLSYLKYYEKDGTEHTNDEGGLKRKLSALLLSLLLQKMV